MALLRYNNKVPVGYDNNGRMNYSVQLFPFSKGLTQNIDQRAFKSHGSSKNRRQIAPMVGIGSQTGPQAMVKTNTNKTHRQSMTKDKKVVNRDHNVNYGI